MKSDYYNYFIMMNYYAVGTNVGSGAQQPALSYALHSQSQLQILLRTISIALTNSINNYQNVLQASTTPSKPQLQPQHLSSAQETSKIQPSSPAQITPQIQVTISAPKAKISPPVNLQPAKSNDGKPSQLVQLPTSEEPPENRPQRLTARDEKTRKKSCAQGKQMEERIGSDTIVDLIETAYLPQLSLSRADLGRIRAELQMRQVEEWNEKARCRWEKRQLRLLGS